MVKIAIIASIFLLGIYFIFNDPTLEGFKEDGGHPYRCPNMLIQQGSKLSLYNSKLAEVPGVNPLTFDNLEDYIEFTDWQRSQGIRCPVLYLQQSYDTQGKTVYKARSDPANLQGGLQDALPGRPLAQQSKLLDGGRSNTQNNNAFPAYDPKGQYIGLDTPLDKMFNAPNNTISPNPMDTTWGGQKYTKKLVDDGYYEGDEVYQPESTME
jgi:hypothetical protein